MGVENYVARFKGIYLDKDELVKIVEDLGFCIFVDNGERIFLKIKKERYRIGSKDLSEDDETFKFLDGSIKGIEFDRKTKYRIYSEGDSIHRRGDGGEIEYRTFLDCECDNILLSRYFVSYWTSGDDYEDYPVLEQKETFVLEDNELTRKIWDEVLARVKKR